MHAYVAARVQGESLVTATGIPATILRPWYVLGPGTKKRNGFSGFKTNRRPPANPKGLDAEIVTVRGPSGISHMRRRGSRSESPNQTRSDSRCALSD